MAGLTDRQRSVLMSIIASAPDQTVRRLEQALSDDADQGGALAEVYRLVAREWVERRVRGAVLGPVIPLCRPSRFGARRFPTSVIPLMWAALHAALPEHVAAAESACCALEEGELSPAEIYNHLCARAAEALRDGDRDFAEVTGALDAAGPDTRPAFIDYLDLVPMARGAIEKLPEWLGRMSEERAAAARLAYKDAVARSDDAGPRLLEMLLAHLTEPWQILRVLAAIVLRANDRYLSDSELGRFGMYILDDIDARLAAFRAFDPDQGNAAGLAAAEHLNIAAQEVAEFENAIELSKDGPWGARVAKAKQTLAQLAESRLAQIDKALDQALPLQLVRFGSGRRGFPKLTADPDPRLIRRAEGLMGFYSGSRVSSATSGFGSTRAKVGEQMDARLDHYVEDLLDILRGPEPGDVERVQAFLEVAAVLIGQGRGEKAAQIVRRRAAAA
jgi:hypothetical protein